MTGSEIVVTFLGSGSAVPDIDRQQSCVALRHKNGLVLFDCGEGSQYALRKYKISTRKEFVIWISHLHSDHFLGLPGLLASFALHQRIEEITIVGPKGIHQTVKNLLIANYVKPTFDVKVVELESGQKFEGTGYHLLVTDALHGNRSLSVLWKENDVPGKVNMKKLKELGIPPGPHISELQEGESIEYEGKVITPEEVIGEIRRGRSVFYSGDTEYNDHLVEFVDSCDLFIHETTYPSEMEELAKERQHCTVRQVAKLSKMIKPQRTVMTHISPRIQNFDKELKIAKSFYEPIEFAYDGLAIEIPYLYHEIDLKS